MFAVKTNPSPYIIETMVQDGLNHFDVASLGEIETIYSISPNAHMSFMHPVKSRLAITKAYFEYGIRDFAFDCDDELQKILECTNFAGDLNLIVRMAIENKKSILPLSSKFGAYPYYAASLLKKARPLANKLGISFHAGSQCMKPNAYSNPLKTISKIVAKTGVELDIVDIGGGFPCHYPKLNPPNMIKYLETIKAAFTQIPGYEKMELWCEPGRVLVAESVSYIVKVELRKKNILYLNEGTFGALYDAGNGVDFIFPTELVDRVSTKKLAPFKFYGPTCDSADFMPGPFMLPSDMKEGDYIEIKMLGAYGSTMRTKFNGFYSDETVIIDDKFPSLTRIPSCSGKTAA